ncbi:guanine nucleotide exchange protein smcr8a-like [Mytilus californianus]|uniref:guanine nucleotide exchange protein smcr8a-like n=1 Tax=Mytilus californianus TaxID=6549 RepID=UPI0022477CA9|nr:guanine nucleotide exchange protein smcr8a-like [Mytilus californianus]
MFGADIAYMEGCMEDESFTDSFLPEYLYPAFRLPNPWHRQPDITQLDTDIIVIAEFSELEGPKPVITIPNDRDIHFNINDFTVRIMSVDLGSSGQQGFNMPEDSQVMMSDTKENVYAFVHHFFLLDKQARGYSRPFAISYVTPDQRKLLNFYEEISCNFKKIARYLKYGNKLVFKNDLDKFMMDLQYTKDQMVNRYRTTIQPGQTDQDNKLLQSLKILESQISEVQGVLSQLNPTLNDKRLEQRFSKIEERAQANKGKPKHDNLSLCDWESIETPENQIQFLSLGSTADTDNLLFFETNHYKPKLVEITKGRKFDLHLRGLHELCSWGAKEGLQRLRHIYQYFKQDIAVLQMEKRDLSLLDPPAGLVTFGNKFIGSNFMTNIDKICISTCCFMRVPGTRTNMESWNMLGHSWSSTDTLSSFKSVPSSFQSVINDDSDSDSMLSATSDLGFYLQRTNSLGSFQLVGSFDSFRNSMTPPKDGFLPDSNRSSLQDELPASDDPLEKTLSNEIPGLEKTLSNEIQGLEKTLSNEIQGLEKTVSNEIQGLEKTLSNEIQGLEKTVSNEIQGSENKNTTQVTLSDMGKGDPEKTLCLNKEDTIKNTGNIDRNESLKNLMTDSLEEIDNHRDSINVVEVDFENRERSTTDSLEEFDNPEASINVVEVDFEHRERSTTIVNEASQNNDTSDEIQRSGESSCSSNNSISEPRDRLMTLTNTDVVLSKNLKKDVKAERDITFINEESEIASDLSNLSENIRKNESVNSINTESMTNLYIESVNNGMDESTKNRKGELTNNRIDKSTRNELAESAEIGNAEFANVGNTDEKKDVGKKFADIKAIENLGQMITKGHLDCDNCPHADVDSSSGVSSCSGCHSKVSQSLQSEDEITVQQKEDISRRGSKTEMEQCCKTDLFRFSTQSETLTPGFGITKILQTYNHIQNVIYSMLTGRTVVVIGSAQYEEEVKNLVTALKLFLPGCHRCQTSCMQWSSKAIAVTDLTDIKLIGICRHEKKSVDRMVPKAVQKYITLFDVERRIIISPVYQGSLITTILSRKKSFKTEESYIQFIKVSLCEFSSKAFIFFHSFCLGTVGTLTSNRGSIISESDSAKKTATAFLSKLGIQDCDIDIMEYLTELVKYQHIEDHYKSLNTTGIPPRPFTRNIHPCQLHRL